MRQTEMEFNGVESGPSKRLTALSSVFSRETFRPVVDLFNIEAGQRCGVCNSRISVSLFVSAEIEGWAWVTIS